MKPFYKRTWHGVNDLVELVIVNWVLRAGEKAPDMYTIFTSERLHNVHYEISTIMEKGMVPNPLSKTVTAAEINKTREQKHLLVIKKCVSMVQFSAFCVPMEKRNIYARMNFCKGFIKFERPVYKYGTEGMLEEKYYQFVYMVLLIVPAFIDGTTGFVWDASMTMLHTKSYELVVKLIKDWDNEEMSSETMLKMSGIIKMLKKVMKNTVETHCQMGLFTLYVKFLDHVLEPPKRFESLKTLRALLLELKNVYIKNGISIYTL